MHSPKYFLGLLAIASSMTLSVNAGPIHQREASLPEFYQPIAEPVPLVQSRIASFGASTVDHAGAKTVATKLISTGVGIDGKDIQISHSHYSAATGLHHVYLTQTHNGLPIVNAVSNVHVEASGDVLSAHHSFAPASVVKSAPVRRGAPPVSLEQAVLKYAAAKGLKTTDKLQVAEKGKNDYSVTGASFAVAPIRGSQKYYQTGSKLIPVWDVNVQLKNVWQNFFVNSESGEIVAVANWTVDYIPDSDSAVPAQVPAARRDAPSLTARAGQILDALYNVIPIGRNNPQSNNGLTKVRSPWNTNASPNGWHFTQNQQTFDLTGNNVFAQSNPNNIQDINQLIALPRPSSNSLTFDYPFDPTKDEKNANNRDAATTNMFYVANSCHDIFYQYGFTEAAGNFQNENFGKGGSENDPVVANSQDGSGTNNANFATGPDGYAGLMRMYVFTPSGVVARDGALENDIIIHEMGHGLSTRLTGGAATANCLNSLISGGMGEGWSDF
ncbi:Fungalysin/Thermolysin Extracellular metalloproteinase 5, partial [Rhizoclosmatium sp. JEL0117]